MALQLSKGLTFVSGTYAATDLNTLVDNGTILPGAITEQTALGAPPNVADSFLLYNVAAGGLRKCTGTNLIGMFPADAAAGTASLRTLGTGAGQAALGSAAPSSVTGLRLGAGAANLDLAATPKDVDFVSLNLAGGVAVDWNLANIFSDNSGFSGGGTRTYTFSHVADGRMIMVNLNLANFTGTIAWPTLVGAIPANTNGKWNVYTFFNVAAGTFGMVKVF